MLSKSDADVRAADTTGTHSVFARLPRRPCAAASPTAPAPAPAEDGGGGGVAELGIELMFHVSTLLPFSPTNRQQLQRKRHIGNDMVTIVFQEAGALPLDVASFRSHFQHVFIVLRAYSPSAYGPDLTTYRCASACLCCALLEYSYPHLHHLYACRVNVIRAEDVPPFGPPIPPDGFGPFGPSATGAPVELAFAEWMVCKCVNAENAVRASKKFVELSTRTRFEYLKGDSLFFPHVVQCMYSYFLNDYCQRVCSEDTLSDIRKRNE